MTDSWTVPGKDCGACGFPTCEQFNLALSSGKRNKEHCVFFKKNCIDNRNDSKPDDIVQHEDIMGTPLDFTLIPYPGEVSARKILLPFRPDLVEEWNIVPGDILTGRPAGAGCPVQHVLLVLSVSKVSGMITCHVVGPTYSRGKAVKDLEAYHIIGFEGIAIPILSEPIFGKRMRFLPGYCMMNLSHTGVVNFIASTKDGIMVRVEDIRLL